MLLYYIWLVGVIIVFAFSYEEIKTREGLGKLIFDIIYCGLSWLTIIYILIYMYEHRGDFYDD